MGGDLGTKVATVGAVNVVEPGLVGVGAAARESVGLGADAGVRWTATGCGPSYRWGPQWATMQNPYVGVYVSVSRVPTGTMRGTSLATAR